MYYARLLRYPICRGQHKELAEKFAHSYQNSEEIPKVLDTDLLYATILYEEDKVTEAMELAERIIAIARKTQKKLKIVEGDLLKVRFMYEQNQSKRELINLLVEAVTYAYENTIAVPFWFEKKTIKILLEAYASDIQSKLSPEEWTFINDVITLRDMDERNHTIQSRFGLSEREQEVMGELAKGCSNKQIAENLCISLATVKSHIINIYGKLGVNNRVAAINKYY
jgi:LuxR family maltose regulon positive regulatory protein